MTVFNNTFIAAVHRAASSARCFPPGHITSSATRSTVAFFAAFSLIPAQTHQKLNGF